MSILMGRRVLYVRTVLSLGLPSVLRVLLYRILKRAHFYLWRTPERAFGGKDAIFATPDDEPVETHQTSAPGRADSILAGQQRLFGGEAFEIGAPPKWHRNPTSGAVSKSFGSHWSQIPDFDPEFGDIKLVWELSRFAWILTFVRAYLQSGDASYIRSANAWAEDWMKCNPVNVGPNWMCGQETAIRLNHVLLADALLRSPVFKSDRLEFFVLRHCERIDATLYYAKGQKNNHIVSEALGLLMGGVWLERKSASRTVQQQGRRWKDKGIRILESSVEQLVMVDGSFAQYSTVYHRLLLDTLSIAEWCRRYYQLPGFSPDFYGKAKAATEWLRNFVDPVTGDAPNLGGNDGALVYALTDQGHREFRPTVQLAGFLFLGVDCFGMEKCGEPIRTLGLEGMYNPADLVESRCYPNGGFAVLRSPTNESRMFVRYPNFQFRPSQSDLLHVDLWCNGKNILRDGGTCGYALSESESQYFVGSAAHNTCQFDDRDQMPRLGRFLYGAWPTAESVEFDGSNENARWSGAYSDFQGCRHHRGVMYRDGAWQITDKVSRFREKAILRWRLCPDVEWVRNDNRVTSKLGTLYCESEAGFKRVELCTGWESRYYLERTPLQVFEVELAPGQHLVKTTIELTAAVS